LKTYGLLGCVLLVAVIFAGCADMEVPSPERIFDDAGARQVSIGMTESEVASIYGEPSVKGTVSSPAWGETREEWVYKADLDTFPVNAGYFSSDLYLYFDGGRLTNISRTPLGKGQGSIGDAEKSTK